MLPQFKNVVSNIDCTNKESVNNVVNSFTNIVRSVADPLFSKQCTFKDTPVFDHDDCIKNADWFDVDCINARTYYLDALKLCNVYKTDQNRIELCRRKKVYKDLIRRKKGQMYRLKMQEIENLKKHKPKDFWKYFKSKTKSAKNNISLDEFKLFFENLSNNIVDCSNEEAESFCDDHNFSQPNNVYPELDNPISLMPLSGLY